MSRRLSIYTFFLILVASVLLLGLLSNAPNAFSEKKNTDTTDKRLEQKTLLVLGDSLSAAYRMAEQDGWVNLLAERLASNTSSDKEKSYTVVNGSISGATTAAGIRSLPLLLERHSPDIVILELGANDGLQGKPIRYITKNLSILLKKIKQAGAKSLVVGVHLPPNYGRGYTEPFFEQFKGLSKKYDSGYVPFLLDGVAQHKDLMMSDGLHPKPEAQMRVLNNVWPVLQTLL